MRNLKGSLRGAVRPGWLHTEADQVVNALTLLLMAASLVLIGSLIL